MKKLKYIIIFVAVIITILFIVRIKNTSDEVMKYTPIANKTIILDAGHGGIDPGAMSSDGSVLEKDINLQITKKINKLIESSGGKVILTREKDVSLYEEGENKTTRQKYNENLKNRKKIIEQSQADMFVSIHLNSFQDSKYYGAQTFYPTGKEDSEALAKMVQTELKQTVDDTNNREIKPRDDLYLIKDNKMPSILIECGFLSNEKEAKLLTEEEYQDKIAWAIYVGIQKYFNECGEI